MLAHSISDIDQTLANLRDAVALTTSTAEDLHGSHALDLIVGCLRAADALTASATRLLGHGGFANGMGLPAEMMLRLEGRRTGADARMLTRASSALSAMPATATASSDGSLSWGQVRAIVSAVKGLDAQGRAAVDRLVGSLAAISMDPDELVAAVDDEVARLRADLTLRHEDVAIERSFLSIQARLDGTASIYGEGDAVSVASIVDALDAAAPPPVDPDAPGAPTRAQQRFDALVGICEGSLSSTGDRARPRVLATLDVSLLSETGLSEAARVLWALAGRPARLSAIATDVLTCDASTVPVIFEAGRPVAVGDATSPIPAKVRTAIAARDGGCRFPGCGAPLAWCDAHHITPRAAGGTSAADNLLMLCRRCHRRVHRYRWRITMSPGDRIEFRHRGRTYSSSPRARPLRRE